MENGIRLFVGLGNLGSAYSATRHNVGAWFVANIADSFGVSLRYETKFHGLFADVSIAGCSCKLLIPTTYMNCSGRAVQAVVNFYKIPLMQILVAHDELDFSAGIARLKFGGGHNGHNGLRDIISVLQDGGFHRLRLGIGRPQNKDVVNYVLGNPSSGDKEKIVTEIDKTIKLLPYLVAGEMGKAMQLLHDEHKEI